MHACPDCPAVRASVFEHLLPNEREPCCFRVATVAERDTIPHVWFGKYAFGLVRRGLLVRQRIDEHGAATAIDVVGPGSAILLDDASGNSSGYAAASAMVCLCPKGVTRPVDLPDALRLHAAALERMDRLADARNRSNAKARVVALLAALSDVIAPPRRLEVIPAELQRKDLAALLALRHESVSRALSDLERAHVIKRTSDGLALHREAIAKLTKANGSAATTSIV